MPKKKTRKPSKRTATQKTSKSRAAARKPQNAQASGSGLVYTDLLREALAGRSRR